MERHCGLVRIEWEDLARFIGLPQEAVVLDIAVMRAVETERLANYVVMMIEHPNMLSCPDWGVMKREELERVQQWAREEGKDDQRAADSVG